MYQLSALPPRRRTVIVINLCLVVIGAIMFIPYLFPGNSSIGYSVFYLLIGLPFLGLFQYCCVVYNIIKGSKIQVYYLIFSLIFLFLYGASLSGWLSLFDVDSEFGLGLLTGLPLLCAIIYTVLLFIDHPANYRQATTHESTLDSDLDLF